MTETGGQGAKAERDKRLAEALRANLRRRKAQARSRRAGDEDARAGISSAAAPSVDKPPESGR